MLTNNSGSRVRNCINMAWLLSSDFLILMYCIHKAFICKTVCFPTALSTDILSYCWKTTHLLTILDLYNDFTHKIKVFALILTHNKLLILNTHNCFHNHTIYTPTLKTTLIPLSTDFKFTQYYYFLFPLANMKIYYHCKIVTKPSVTCPLNMLLHPNQIIV